jgi:16S rRNA (adenine1518-N6/adenine1519-N6)-dimethyltransferase
MKLSEMKQLLAAGRIQLTKSLGQNFLHDANQLRRIVAAAELTKSDKVLEVGPGLGPLTELLVEQAGEVLAIEKDARLVEVVRERFKVAEGPHWSPSKAGAESEPRTEPVLRLVHDDALDFLRREPRDWSEWKLVSNLPYSAASPILVELAQAQRGPQRMVATLQLEVARRLMARPGEKEYGVLPLLMQLNYEPRDWFKVTAGCFFPEPEVDSACVCLVRRPQPLLNPQQSRTFAKLVKRAFSQRRKIMLKLLKADWGAGDLERAFEELKLSASVRAESVSLQQFVDLARLCHGSA